MSQGFSRLIHTLTLTYTSFMAKNPHAVALGRKGGKIGGRRRAEKMTPEQRSESARMAVMARWQRAKEAASQADDAEKTA